MSAQKQAVPEVDIKEKKEKKQKKEKKEKKEKKDKKDKKASKPVGDVTESSNGLQLFKGKQSQLDDIFGKGVSIPKNGPREMY
jgi:hypothetical protein